MIWSNTIIFCLSLVGQYGSRHERFIDSLTLSNFTPIQREIYYKLDKRLPYDRWLGGINFWVDENGIVNSITFPAMGIKYAKVYPLDLAYSFFEQNKDVFGIDNVQKELTPEDSCSGKMVGEIHFIQKVNGVIVYHHECLMGFFIKGDSASLASVDSWLLPNANRVDTNPKMSKEIAAEILRKEFSSKGIGIGIDQKQTQLIIYEVKNEPRLAWKMVTISGQNDFMEYKFIDAITGQKIGHELISRPPDP